MTITEQQSNAYFATDYHVFTPEGVMVLPSAGAEFDTMSALLHNFGVSTAAFITAYNPASVLLEDAINLSKQDELRKEVATQWQFLEGQGVGRYGDKIREPSVFVMGITLEEAQALGRKYGQLAFLFCTDNGRTELRVCNPEDEASLIHPAERMMNRLTEHLRAKGHTVTKVIRPPSGEMEVSFISRQRQLNPEE